MSQLATQPDKAQMQISDLVSAFKNKNFKELSNEQLSELASLAERSPADSLSAAKELFSTSQQDRELLKKGQDRLIKSLATLGTAREIDAVRAHDAVAMEVRDTTAEVRKKNPLLSERDRVTDMIQFHDNLYISLLNEQDHLYVGRAPNTDLKKEWQAYEPHIADQLKKRRDMEARQISVDRLVHALGGDPTI